jgi:hypothetical protein
MDELFNKDICNKTKFKFNNKEELQKKYDIIFTWQEIKQKILQTYTNPIIKINPKFNNKNNKFLELLNMIKPTFYKQNYNSVKSSLYYLFYKYQSGFYVRIRNNELCLFYAIKNLNYENPLYDKFKVYPFNKNRVKGDPKLWIDLGGVITNYPRKYCKSNNCKIEYDYYQLKYFLIILLKKYRIQDCDFIINNKDRLTIKRDLTEPSEELIGSTNYELDSKFKFTTYIPFLSFTYNERYADYPIITPDDIIRTYNIFHLPDECNNPYDVELNTEWTKKMPTAIFRGSYTGSSAEVRENPRLHISMLNNEWKSKYKGYLDAGLNTFYLSGRGRKTINNTHLKFLDKNYEQYLKKDFMSYTEQSNYKYVVYIEGNVAAYRGAFLFSWKSVVLWVKSEKYHLWFEPYLKDKVNCIFIDKDLSNLKQTIEWLKKNDDKAQEIANNGYQLYLNLLNSDSIEDYMQYLLNYL